MWLLRATPRDGIVLEGGLEGQGEIEALVYFILIFQIEI
jgi:hypothetical protein